MNLKFTFFLLLASLFFCPLHAQPGFQIGTLEQMQSEILEEERQLLIYLPQKAKDNPALKFPVLYVLDGESYFHSFTGAVSHLSETNGNAIIPEMIVVAIVNVDRNRDFSPTEDPNSRFEHTGGAPAFTRFLLEELIPYVDKNYPTAPYKILAGHSLGGVETIYTLINHPNSFNAYLALDPAIWWDNEVLTKQLPQLWEVGELNHPKLFLAMANSLPPGMNTVEAMKDTTPGSLGFRSIENFRRALTLPGNPLQWQCQYYPKDNHGSVTLPAMLDGLRYLFPYYKRPSFVILDKGSPAKLENHYLRVSREMGYAIPPPERSVVGLAWRARVLDQNAELGLAFLKMGDRYWPESIELHYQWGEYYTELGEAEKAEAAFLKAKALEEQAKPQ